MKYKIYCFLEALGPIVFALTVLSVIIAASPFWVPFVLLVWFFDKEEKRYKGISDNGYQPIGPSLNIKNPPKGGSGLKEPKRKRKGKKK